MRRAAREVLWGDGRAGSPELEGAWEKAGRLAKVLARVTARDSSPPKRATTATTTRGDAGARLAINLSNASAAASPVSLPHHARVTGRSSLHAMRSTYTAMDVAIALLLPVSASRSGANNTQSKSYRRILDTGIDRDPRYTKTRAWCVKGSQTAIGLAHTRFVRQQ